MCINNMSHTAHTYTFTPTHVSTYLRLIPPDVPYHAFLEQECVALPYVDVAICVQKRVTGFGSTIENARFYSVHSRPRK